MADNLRIPKRAASVEVHRIGAEPRTIRIFLAEHLPDQPLGERLLDGLIGRKRFLPVGLEDGATQFLSLQHVLWLRVDVLQALDVLDLADEGDDSSTARVRLHLLDASSLEGLLRYHLPPERSRLSDYLEDLPVLFPLRTSDWIYLVHRDAVLAVDPLLEEGPK